jgi:DNA-binding GntR family transcriptional regulator
MEQPEGYRESHEIELVRRRMARLDGGTGQAYRPEGKAGRIFDEVEQRLATGIFPFGSEILTQDLVREFSSSRAPVTMAMNMMQAAGYVTIRPQVGVWVVAPNQEEIAGFFTLYARSEAMHTLAATRRASDEGLALLEHIAAVIAGLPADTTLHVRRELLSLTSLFHQQVRAMAATPWLCQHSASAWRMSNFLIAGRPSADALAMRAREADYRKRLVGLMQAGEAEAAGALMEEFIVGRFVASPADQPS